MTNTDETGDPWDAHNEVMARWRALGDAAREELRCRDLLAGISSDDCVRLDEENRASAAALTAKLKEENDALEAQLIRRRTLRLVSND